MFQPWQGATVNLQHLQSSPGSTPDVRMWLPKFISRKKQKTVPNKLAQHLIYFTAAKVLQRTTEDTQVQFILGNTRLAALHVLHKHQWCHILGWRHAPITKASVRHTVELAGRILWSVNSNIRAYLALLKKHVFPGNLPRQNCEAKKRGEAGGS